MEDISLLFLITKLLNKNKSILIHGRRVAKFASAIAGKMGYCHEGIQQISFAAVVHDIGKMQLPEEIINKPGALTAKELALIKEHPERGCRLLRNLKSDSIIAEVALQHHERLDGSGYPFGVRAHQINPVSRIIAVADVIDAMFFPQVYRQALSLGAVVEELKAHSGLLYDPQVAAISIALLEKEGVSLERDPLRVHE